MPLTKATDAELRVLVAEVRKGHEALSEEFKKKHEENAREFDGIKAEQKAMRKDITGLQGITGSVNELRILVTDHAVADLRELEALKTGQAELKSGQDELNSKLDKNTSVTEKVDNFLRFGRSTLSVGGWIVHQLKANVPALVNAIILYLILMAFFGRGPMPPLH